MSSSVTFATAKINGDQEPDWSTLARPGHTLVLYMSVGSIAETVKQLISRGLTPGTPVAMVENGTTGRQRVLRATLDTVAEDAIEARICAPAIMIVGATAGLGEELEWFSADQDVSESKSDHSLLWHRAFKTPSGASHL